MMADFKQIWFDFVNETKKIAKLLIENSRSKMTNGSKLRTAGALLKSLVRTMKDDCKNDISRKEIEAICKKFSSCDLTKTPFLEEEGQLFSDFLTSYKIVCSYIHEACEDKVVDIVLRLTEIAEYTDRGIIKYNCDVYFTIQMDKDISEKAL